MTKGKINEAVGKFPWIAEKIGHRSVDNYSSAANAGVEDIELFETPRFCGAIAKWDEHNWGKNPYTGVGWRGWLEVYSQQMDTGEISEIKTPAIATRNRYDSSFDRTDLWPYNFASVVVVGENELEVAWADEKGDKGPTYRINLADRKILRGGENGS